MSGPRRYKVSSTPRGLDFDVASTMFNDDQSHGRTRLRLRAGAIKFLQSAWCWVGPGNLGRLKDPEQAVQLDNVITEGRGCHFWLHSCGVS